MNINKVKEYGEFVEIAAPVERTTAEEYPTVLGGEIWYPKIRKQSQWQSQLQ